MTIKTLALATLFLALPVSAKAADSGRVIGDSIGVGVSWAAKIPSTARNSVSIYSGAIMEQLNAAQKGETVFLSLGTNDAVGGALDVKAKVAAIVAQADKLGVKLVWIGPPCVLKPWEEYARKLDAELETTLAPTSATYVSTQGADFCDASVHAQEGVHFNMTGYTRIWRKASAAVGFTGGGALVADASATSHSAKSRPHRRHKRHAHYAKAAERQADATPK
jgi:hypothetical protein